MALTAKQEAFAQAYRGSKNFALAASKTGSEYSKGRGYYVYFLVDPRSQEIFYVGKGKGCRISDHVKQAIKGNISNAEKHKRITEVLSAGQNVQEFVFCHYELERDAFDCEKAFIEAFRHFGLTNIANGVVTNDEKISEEAKFLLTQLVPESWFHSHGKPEMREAINSVFGSFRAYDTFVKGVLSKLIAPSILDKNREVAHG